MPVSRSAAVALLGCWLAVGSAMGAATGAATGAAAASADPDVAFRFADDRIDESSGLAGGGRVLFTVNDSGDGPHVYAVDKQTGETVGVTTYSDEAVADVEAMAAGRGRTVWVGDIGDNDAVRSTVDVYRFKASARGDRSVTAQRYPLAYPDRPRDAEALLVHPRTGRVYVVSKEIQGGTVYAAPARLRESGVNRLEERAKVAGLVTGGAFFPDGRHVVLRTYFGATVYTFPGFSRVTDIEVPSQEQGEAVTVGPAGTIFVSSEGTGAAVYAVEAPALPTKPASAGPERDRPADGEQAAEPGRADRAADDAHRTPPASGLDRPLWLGALTGVVLAAALGWRLVRAFRRRGRRRR